MVIIISSSDDAHLPYVVKHLRNPYVIVDMGSIMEGGELTYSFKDGGLQVDLGGQRLTNVTGVWVRRPRRFDRNLAPPPVPSGHVQYSKSAIARHMQHLYALFSDALWVSDHYAISRAENKALQLVQASQLGFSVPETLITSSSAAALQFISAHPSSIVKTQALSTPILDERHFLHIFTTRINKDNKLSYEGLHLAPSIFQQEIEPLHEIRATVVGDKVFATLVTMRDGSSDANIRDWHAGGNEEGVEYSSYDLSSDIAAKCVRLVKKLGLHYGAIDIIEDRKGVYWFLEINPNGQWAFVEHATGQPIGKAIAMLLEAGVAREQVREIS